MVLGNLIARERITAADWVHNASNLIQSLTGFGLPGHFVEVAQDSVAVFGEVLLGFLLAWVMLPKERLTGTNREALAEPSTVDAQ